MENSCYGITFSNIREYMSAKIHTSEKKFKSKIKIPKAREILQHWLLLLRRPRLWPTNRLFCQFDKQLFQMIMSFGFKSWLIVLLPHQIRKSDRDCSCFISLSLCSRKACESANAKIKFRLNLKSSSIKYNFVHRNSVIY